MKVRIIKSKLPTYWYSNYIGEIFDIEEEVEEGGYRVKSNSLAYIQSGDFKILPSQMNTAKNAVPVLMKKPEEAIKPIYIEEITGSQIHRTGFITKYGNKGYFIKVGDTGGFLAVSEVLTNCVTHWKQQPINSILDLIISMQEYDFIGEMFCFDTMKDLYKWLSE